MSVSKLKKAKPTDTRIELLNKISGQDMRDLCDATVLAIKDGGGFGWLEVPEQDVMQRFWEGVAAMPSRYLFVARLDGTICGTTQLLLPAQNNQAQSHSASLISTFVAPWARGYGLARSLVETAEARARKDDKKIINLDVRETQMAAIRLYESLGYIQCGIHPHYACINDETIRGYYYYKELS